MTRLFTRKAIAQLVLLVAALSVFLFLSKRWPKDRTFHFILGDAAPKVEELEVQYDAPGENEPERAAAFHFAPGQAPRIVTHEARLAEGDYTLEIEVASHSDRMSVRRSVKVEGDAITTIDLSRDILRDLGR